MTLLMQKNVPQLQHYHERDIDHKIERDIERERLRESERERESERLRDIERERESERLRESERGQLMVKKMCIFTYWNEVKHPPLVTRCLKSWEKHMPECEIHIYNTNTVPTDLDLPENWRDLSHAFFTDILRLSLLSKYGGIWMDATILLNKPLTIVSYGAFKHHKHYPESWCIVATSPNPHIIRWLNATKSFVEYHPQYDKHPVYTQRPELPWFHLDRQYYMIYDAYLIAGGNDGPVAINQSWQFFFNYGFEIANIVKFTRNCRIIYRYRIIIRILFVIILSVIIITCIKKMNLQ